MNCGRSTERHKGLLHADDERIADGTARLKQWEAVLTQAEQKYGVDRHTIVAVWGVESDYGKSMGARPLVRSRR